MAIKFRKVGETAFLEPPKAGVRRPFNFAKAFFFAGVIIAVVVVLGVLVVGYLKGRVNTTDAWAEPADEVNIVAQADAIITELRVKFDQEITQEDVDKGFVLFKTKPTEASAAEAVIKKYEEALKVEVQRLALLKGGANVGLDVTLNDLQQRLRDKQKALDDEKLRRGKAQLDFDLAKDQYDKAQKYFDERVITIDRLEDAKIKYDRATLDLKTANQLVAQAQKAVDEVQAEIDATVGEGGKLLKPEESRKKMTAIQEAKVEGARADLEKAKADMGIGEYKAEFPGRIGSIQVNEGVRVSKGDRILKIYRSESMEIKARLDVNLARDVKAGQKVDVKFYAGSEAIEVEGTVISIGNPVFQFPRGERERLRTEVPNVDFSTQEIRVSIASDEKGLAAKKALYPGKPASVTIHTR